MVEVPKVEIAITREDKASGGRYVARIAGKPDAEMTFSKAGEKILIIDHTGVPDELGGMGVGKALVEYMVHDVRARGLKIIPSALSPTPPSANTPNGRTSSRTRSEVRDRAGAA